MAGALALGGGALTLGFRWNRMIVRADSSAAPNFTPTKLIRYNKDNHGLKLTLFQFQTCPFCCKTRAFLDYYGISYDVVEVNSVTKKQLKWSQYKKVPVLVVNGVGKDGFLQLNESSVIMSLLESYLINPKYKLEELKSYYPCIESKEGRKVVYDFPNRYYVMYGADVTKQVYDERKQERKWRFWSDDNLVHVLSPNVYRTMSESLATFRYFSDVGDWEKNFSRFERLMVIYVGATVMYFVGKMLKKKHKLKKDVRESLYDSCREWTRALGTKQPFMGGKNPDLSDLAVYGVLSSIEGCEAFQDALKHTKIGPWYNRTKEAVKNNLGASVPLRK
ncbi:hypothetical protein LOTGIDRAFT_180368 [Lottia gigantea]|uniref:Prostaglandin E synthase 2 n=1 Tax=Lottia gigantea TaxID=225164 RepID=V4AAB4_LOTGI|nr:hypothetical protein LOTGIDRAFT_180368 [Lottia gigantea]ESP00899.1 hypothetical protein LOTGIDRAFT_180368 [Lottia gigantea]